MSDYAVSTAFSAKDNGLTGAFKRMGKAAMAFRSDTTRSFKDASESATSFKNITKGILAAGVVQRGLGFVSSGVRSLSDEFIAFDGAITQTSAKLGIWDKHSESFRRLELEARKVGAATQFSATQAAEGYSYLAMAGYNLEQTIGALPGIVDLATNANVDLKEATDIATDALAAMGMASDNPAIQAKNLGRMTDILSKSVNTANFDLQIFFETIKNSGSVATQAGIELHRYAAIAGTLASAGNKGSQAATTLKNAFLRLQAPTPQAAKMIQKLGLTVVDEGKNLKDPIDIIGQLSEKTREMGTAQKAAALNVIFGQEAISGINILLDVGADKINDYAKTLDDSDGVAKKMADTIRLSLPNQLASLKSAALEAGLKFVDAFKDKIPTAIESATEAVRNFNIQPVVDGVQKLMSALTRVKSVMTALSPIIAGVVAGFISYRVALTAVIAIQAVQKFLALASAFKAAAVAQGVLNAVMAANPLLLIASAVGLVIAGAVALYKNWDVVKAKLTQVWDWFSGMLDNPFFTAIATIVAPWLTIPALIVKHWDLLKAMFSKALSWIKGLLQQAWDWFSGMLDNPFFTAIATIVAPWLTIPALIVKHWDKIKATLLSVWENVKKGFSRVWDWFTGLLDDPIFGEIATIFAPFLAVPALVIKHWDKIKEYFKNFWNGIVEFFTNPAYTITDALEGLASMMGVEVEHKIKPPAREPPNATELESRMGVDINGRFDFYGLPPQTTMQTEFTGAPNIRTHLMGQG